MTARIAGWAALRGLRGALIVADPGGLRLRQAARTVIAVLLALGTFWESPRDERLFAAVGAGFFMQCGEGKRRGEQMRTLLVAGLVMTFATGLATAINGYVWWGQGAVLTVAAFLAYYTRRFAPSQGAFTMFGFTLPLLATVLPGHMHEARDRVVALLVALGYSFVVCFHLFPPDRVIAFGRALRIFCAATAADLRDLAAGQPEGWAARAVDRLIAFNQGLADVLPDGERRDRIEQLLFDQYDAHQALRLLRDAVGSSLNPDERQRIEFLASGFAALAEGTPEVADQWARVGGNEKEFRLDPDFIRASSVSFSLQRLRQYLVRLTSDLPKSAEDWHE